MDASVFVVSPGPPLDAIRVRLRPEILGVIEHRARDGLFLVVDAGGHPEELVDGDRAIPGFGGEAGDVADQPRVGGGDQAVLLGAPDRDGGEGLGHREAGQARLGGDAVEVALVDDDVVVQDQHRRGVVFADQGVERVVAVRLRAPHREAGLGARTGEGPGVRGRRHDARVEVARRRSVRNVEVEDAGDRARRAQRRQHQCGQRSDDPDQPDPLAHSAPTTATDMPRRGRPRGILVAATSS